MQIYTNTDTNSWVCYYYETNTASANFSKLCRTESPTNGNHDGHRQLRHQHHQDLQLGGRLWKSAHEQPVGQPVIGVTLQFYQLEYPLVKVGPGSFYDFYQLHTRVTRRKN